MIITQYRYLDQGTVGYSLVLVKCYMPHVVTTKPSPSHITAENGHLLLTVQTLAVRGILKLHIGSYFNWEQELKLSALALSLLGA